MFIGGMSLYLPVMPGPFQNTFPCHLCSPQTYILVQNEAQLPRRQEEFKDKIWVMLQCSSHRTWTKRWGAAECVYN